MASSAFSWSYRGTTKKFDPVPPAWQRDKAHQLRVPVKSTLKYGRPKYFDHNCSPKQTIPIEPDGNCFFRALSVLVTGVEDFHQTIREQVTGHVSKNSDIYRTFLQSRGGMNNYVKSMSRSREWATDTEIFAAATFLRTIIEVCSPNHRRDSRKKEYEWQTFTPLNDDNVSLPKIYISHNNEHFEPILDIDIHVTSALSY